MGKVNYQKRWVSQELDDPAVRKKFIRHLKRWHNEFTTLYWKSQFIDWLVYESTIQPCGLSVESIDSSFVRHPVRTLRRGADRGDLPRRDLQGPGTDVPHGGPRENDRTVQVPQARAGLPVRVVPEDG